MKYFISMGSNEGPSEEIMGAALHKLSLMPLLSIGKVSSLYKTPPWGKTDQAEFLNAVIEADWQDTPEGLLELLLDTEKAFGRRRMMRWGPRTLDLDLLYGENVEKQTEFLKILAKSISLSIDECNQLSQIPYVLKGGRLKAL